MVDGNTLICSERSDNIDAPKSCLTTGLRIHFLSERGRLTGEGASGRHDLTKSSMPLLNLSDAHSPSPLHLAVLTTSNWIPRPSATSLTAFAIVQIIGLEELPFLKMSQKPLLSHGTETGQQPKTCTLKSNANITPMPSRRALQDSLVSRVHTRQVSPPNVSQVQGLTQPQGVGLNIEYNQMSQIQGFTQPQGACLNI